MSDEENSLALRQRNRNQIGDRLRLDFGANGIGVNGAMDNPATDGGDGFYRVFVDINGDGDFADSEDSRFGFHRIFGDADGDAVAAFADADFVLSQLGLTGENLEGDVDGANGVNFDDYFYALDQAAVGNELALALKNQRDD